MSGEAPGGEMFTSLELDTIGEIMNISMGSAATAASTLLDTKVMITTPKVNVLSIDEFELSEMGPTIAVEIKYIEGISGSNVLILKRDDMRAILAQMIGSEVPEGFEGDNMAESAMCELMNQMMGSSATVLSCFLGRTINISTPMTVPVADVEEFKRSYFEDGQSQVLAIKFAISIKDIMESEFVSVMSIDLAKEIIDVSLNFDAQNDEPEVSLETPAPPSIEQAEAAYTAPASAPTIPPAPGMQAPTAPQYPGAGAHASDNPVVVRDFEFADFGAGAMPQADLPANMDLVMNVPVVVTVELGRTKRKIKEILEFGQGTIVELDKQAGSQVDVIVNGQLIARGDVVVVDDNFSIRITDILKSRDSIASL